MASILPNDPCPCGSGKKYKKCCANYHHVHKGMLPPSPVLLMRSRYAAYAAGLADYIIETTHPDGPMWEKDLVAWRESIEDFGRSTVFEKLEVLEDSEEGEQGFVHFHAHLRQAGKPVLLDEHSVFRKHEGRWKYVGIKGKV
ncbi:MAG: SEC-C domain-containing protein [Myxococcales bacterium]|nr:SEC-C domain-containing protein [Myxococcales bacterium]